MTYATLIAEFRLRVLKDDADYDEAKKFWYERVRFAIHHCKLEDADGVQEYAEVLTELMGLYEKKKLEETPTEPDTCDWVTEDYIVFREFGGKGVIRVPIGGPWQIAVKDRMDREQFWSNVWSLSDHGNYELLSLEDEE